MKKTISIVKAQKEFQELVKKAGKKSDKYVITLKDAPSVILMSNDEYESLQETLEILSDKELMKSIRVGEKEIAEGKGIPWEDIEKELGLD